ncbi:hypothetical protein CY35_15G000700 [Sphagnum magellanicum]|nr:hypothetical protein CY35_15G000700 [Sphagnum magellanicum]
MATRSISNLPTARYIAICNRSNSKYLTLLKVGLLTFTASEKVRLAVHEVVYKTGLPDDVVLLRCANGRFWRLSESDSSIRADWESIPGVSDTACHFTTVVVREGVIAFRSIRNGQYAKRYTGGGYTDCYSAMISSLDQFCEVQVSAANDNALTLPRYLTFKGDNDKFMANYLERDHYWQKFHKSNADLSCIYEVAPLLDGSVSLRSIEVNRFFRLSPNWIWADSASPTSNVLCHFEPVNNQFVKRHSDYWTDCLCAVGTSVNDSNTHLTMKEAVNNRTLSNIRYLLDFAEISDIELIFWSNSVTVSLEVTTEFTAGVPLVASVSGEITVGSSYTHTSEFGSTTENSVEFQTLFNVPQVPPGRTARVKVQCQKAKCRVPFTYTMKDTRIDGVDFPTEDRIDGICEAANVFDVKGIASWDDARGITTEITLPVDVTRGDPHPRTQK